MRKRILSYTAGFILLVFALVSTGCRRGERTMNERITLKQKDKIPYGTAVAKKLLSSLLPRTTVYYDNNSPGNWDQLTSNSYNQAVILVANNFNADYGELSRLQYFASQGNYVFIIARTFSRAATDFFRFTYSGGLDGYMNFAEDSLRVRLEQPAFASNQLYVYPGRKYASSFSTRDTNFAAVLGTNEHNAPNYLEFKTGEGRIFIHTAPLAFSNYFILHKNNVGYFEKAVSVIPIEVDRLVWNEYYLSKPASDDQSDRDPSWFRVLFRYPAFKWGLLTVMFMLLLYALLESRRRQRKIPFYNKPQNDSLDFVKTLGRLYHDRRDHQNLAKKMSVYFLEHVRSAFKLPTHTLDENFMRALHYKSGYPAEDLSHIFSFITYLNENGTVNEKQLAGFHKQLELFYQTT